MKKPYISLYTEEYQVQKSETPFYDHFTQINYSDRHKTQSIVEVGPRDTSTETRTIENNDVDERSPQPDTTIFTETVENGDIDFYVPPDTTISTFTRESTDIDEYIYI